MMCENFISYSNKILGNDNKYFVETDDEINILRLKNATKIENIHAVRMDSLFNKGIKKIDYLKSYSGLKNVIDKSSKEIDLVVVLGGDDFTEDYGWKGPILNAIKFNLLKRAGLKVIMIGQTMGPYENFREPIMKHLLSKLDMIYPRDPLTYEYLKKINLKNIEITDDLALIALNNQKEEERNQKYITYCPSELIYRYSKEGNRQDWIEFNLFMIDEILNKFPEKKLLLLPHVLLPKHVDDRIIANELYELIKDKYKDSVIIFNEEMYPAQVRSYIQQSYFTISSRMHPIVSSIQCEIPSIALSYSTKYWGIIGERYGLSEYIIDVRHLNYNEMKVKFKNLIDKIDEEYIQIQTLMKEKNKQAENSIIKTIKEIKSIS